MDVLDREQLIGTQMMTRHAELERAPQRAGEEMWKRNLEHGLDSAASIGERWLPRFSRLGLGPNPIGTFGMRPYLEDMRQLGGQDVAVVGIPFDGGTSHRPGARFGPQSIRYVSTGDGGYNHDLGISLWHSLDIVDVGDVTVIPADIEKTFDQIDSALGYIVDRGVFPVVLGGDHSIAYATIRSLAARTDGPVGLIHFDRHADLSRLDHDGRLHGTPFYHATDIPNVSAQQSRPDRGGRVGWRLGWGGHRPRAGINDDHDDRYRPLRDRAHRRTGPGDRLERRQDGLSLVRHRLHRPRLCPGHRDAGIRWLHPAGDLSPARHRGPRRTGRYGGGRGLPAI